MSKDREYGYRIWKVDRDSLILRCPFLTRALSALEPEEGKREAPAGEYGTDGVCYFYDEERLIRDFLSEERDTERIYLHSVLHCLFLHPFLPEGGEEPELRDLSSDICVWDILSRLLPKRPGEFPDPRDGERESVTAHLKDVCGMLSPEPVAHCLGETADREERRRLSALFRVDDHRLWPGRREGRLSEEKRKGKGNPAAGTGPGEGQRGAAPLPGGEGTGDSLPKQWREIARKSETGLREGLFSRDRDLVPGDLILTLEKVGRERVDYTGFLRKFACVEERLLTDADSFDPGLYHYGLSLYEDMPLLEPLEYKETETIRSFAVAVDTSGSCSAELIRFFLRKTFGLLLTPGVFDRRMEVLLLQCDSRVQEETWIHSPEDLEACMERLTIRGRGGTDFNPVFARIGELRKGKKLLNLRGLLYFTDGNGVFPVRPPDYRTAFLLSGWKEPVKVPPWAMKVYLDMEGGTI